ncbi:MAG: multidrug effflux MFS transporter [Sphingobium sp.]
MTQHSTHSEKDAARALPELGRFEFVALMAALMSCTALSIDPMLPALPDIGRDLAVLHDNDRQMVVTFFFLGLAGGAIFYGPLSDHFGRKPVLLTALCFFFIFTMICALAPSFPILLAARLLAGFVAAACRVTVASIVRDRFQGDAMARMMSHIMMVFMIVPILAPSFGAAILYFAPWRAIFWALAGVILCQLVWLALRLPETLAKEYRVHIRPRDLGRMFVQIVTHRSSIGYMVASGVMMSGLVGYIVSAQQIFFDTFHQPAMLPLGFAFIGTGMAFGSLFNSRLVERFGARRMSQSAVIMLILLSAIHCGINMIGLESLWSFILLQALTVACFSFAGANFSAIALEPFQRGAGLASSLQASLMTFVSSGLGGMVGARFDGTTQPIALGFLTFGIAALLIILWAERGRLFTRPGRSHLRTQSLPDR